MSSAVVPLQSGGPLDALVSITGDALSRLVGNVVAALPRILAGIIFLTVAAIGIRIIKHLLRYSLKRTFPNEPRVYRQFIVAIVMLFLWFGVGLSFLSVVGLEQIAASLGSAAGFLALGVSYALSNVIADVVAGVYLLRDEDFMPGDEVDIGGTVGTVQSIELRKTRLTVNDGQDTMVRNNAEIEKKWTKLDDETRGTVGGGDNDPPDSTGEAVAAQAEEGSDAAAIQTEEVADEATDTAEKQAEEVVDEATDGAEERVEEVTDADGFTDPDVKETDG